MSISHTTPAYSSKGVRYEQILPQTEASSSQSTHTIEIGPDTADSLHETTPIRPIWIPPYYTKGHSWGQDYNKRYTKPAVWVRFLSSGGLAGLSAAAGITVMLAMANALRSRTDEPPYSFAAALEKGAPRSTESFLLSLGGTLAGSIAAAPLNAIPFTSHIANAASYTGHRIKHWTNRHSPGDSEQGQETVEVDKTVIPQGQKSWDADHQELTILPKFPHTLEFIDVSHNRLITLSPESFRELIENRSSKHKGISLNLSNNSLRTVPPFLLDLHFRSFINLQNNPISRQEIDKIYDEKNLRALNGISSPEFIFRAIEESHTDANVYTKNVDFLIQKNLHALVKMFPQVVVDNKIRVKLLADLQDCAARYPEQLQPQYGTTSILKLATRGVQHMWTDPESREVLAYVHAFIHGKPQGSQRDQGLIQLLYHLSYAQGNNAEETIPLCLYRHRAEALSSLSAAYTDAPNCLPFGAVRDLLFAHSQRILKHLLAEINPKTPVDEVQTKFEISFRAALQEQKIPNEHINQFIQEFAFAEWKTFCEMAEMPEEAVVQHTSMNTEKRVRPLPYHPLLIE